MKSLKITSIICLFAVTNSYAAINANPGLYVGGALTYSNPTIPSGTSLSGALNASLFAFGLRPVIGYRFTDYLAIEGGFLDVVNDSNPSSGEWGPDNLRIYSFDASIKGFMPFESNFSLFGKTGLAYTHQYVYNKYSVYDREPLVDKTTNAIQPLIGAGVSYNFTKKLATEFSYTYYAPSRDIGKNSVFMLGLNYTFGEDA